MNSRRRAAKVTEGYGDKQIIKMLKAIRKSIEVPCLTIIFLAFLFKCVVFEYYSVTWQDQRVIFILLNKSRFEPDITGSYNFALES